MNSWNCSDAGRVGEQRGEKAREQVSHCRVRPWGPCLMGASEPTEPEKCLGDQPSLLLSAASVSPPQAEVHRAPCGWRASPGAWEKLWNSQKPKAGRRRSLCINMSMVRPAGLELGCRLKP